MKIQKIKIKEEVFDINLNFYNLLKKITQSKLTKNQINDILSMCIVNQKNNVDFLKEKLFEYVVHNVKRKDYSSIYAFIDDLDDRNISLVVFSLKLNLIKDLLLLEAKFFQNQKAEELSSLDQLSLAYDKVSTQVAYATRISGALISLIFFDKIKRNSLNFVTEASESFLEGMVASYEKLSKQGLEPNQIFMLLFSESINQSITSSAGASYEDRIKNVLIDIGIPKDEITKAHHENDSATEFDFLFNYENRSYGISAKRTLRERYKQFINTAYNSGKVMLEITLGTDLSESKAKTIRGHGVYIFVSDEVFLAKNYLSKIEGIYPASKLSIKLLKSLK
jgi:hypothetical protein